MEVENAQSANKESPVQPVQVYRDGKDWAGFFVSYSDIFCLTKATDLLRIKSPRGAEPVAKHLLAYKSVVMAALAETDRCEALVPDRTGRLRRWADELGSVA